MKIPKLARAAFETEMLSAAKHGHECLLTHAECRENTQKFLSEVFKCFLTAEDTCFPTSRLTVFASLANVEIKDSIGRIWSRWGIYPKATMEESLVVSLSPDQKTVGIWSINDNVLFATVSVPDWSVHDELTK